MPTIDLNIQDQISEAIQAATYHIGEITLSELFVQLSKLRRVSSTDIFLASDRNDIVDTILLFLKGLNQLGANVPIPILRKAGPLVKITLDDQNDAVDGIELIADAMFILGVPMGPPRLRKVHALDIKSSEDHNQLVDALWMMYYIARDYLTPTFEGGPTIQYDTLYEYMRMKIYWSKPIPDYLLETIDVELFLQIDLSDSISESFELLMTDLLISDSLSEIIDFGFIVNIDDSLSEIIDFAITNAPLDFSDSISEIIVIIRLNLAAPASLSEHIAIVRLLLSAPASLSEHMTLTSP